jgi:N-acyl-D-amino-acid deacylase
MSGSSKWVDLLLRGGLVVDGSGESPRVADVVVSRGKVEFIGDASQCQATELFDATGLAVAPGFIDMHTHSDLSLIINPRAESAVRQGVTTQVIGMCGSSVAPAPTDHHGIIRAMWGGSGEAVEWTWESFADYLDVLNNRGPATNVVPVVGHSVLRAVAMGLEHRAPRHYELSMMCDLLRDALREGAFGFSSGLVYTPSMYAETDELVALAKAMSERGGIYFTHMRGEADTRVAALEEAITIGREGGVPVQLAHLKCDGRSNWGQAEATLELVIGARDAGVDITYDAYPYAAWNTGLTQLLPAWAREGGREAIVLRLSDFDARQRIREFLVRSAEEEPGKWERRLISSVVTEGNRPYQGKTLAEIADLRAHPAEDVIMDLLGEEKASVGMVGFGMHVDDVKVFVAYPQGMIGSDSASSAPYGRLGLDHPHPRTYGSFVRVLGFYARDGEMLPLETAVAKMSRLPAERLGLKNRGLLAPGKAADLVLFDPATVADRATYDQPHLYPEGVRRVYVNGQLVVDGEHHTGAKAGRVLAKT